MDYENKTLLENEIERLLKELSYENVTTDEYKTTVDELVKLIDRSNEARKIQNEYEEKVRCRERDYELKLKQLNDEKKSRVIDHSINIASVLVTSLITIWGTKVSLKFEETGSITTIMGRGFINKLLPKK